jgi:hypothetical protein
MPFIPRSQQAEQAAAQQPPSMAVVENRQPQFATTAASNDEQAEQIAELNELLVHVLDEISSLKEAMYQNTRRDSRRPTRGSKGKRRHITEEESDEESGESEEAETEMTDDKGRNKKSAATATFTTTPHQRGIDFSNCF